MEDISGYPSRNVRNIKPFWIVLFLGILLVGVLFLTKKINLFQTASVPKKNQVKQVDPFSKWPIYHNSDLGFSLRIPKEWQINVEKKDTVKETGRVILTPSQQSVAVG